MKRSSILMVMLLGVVVSAWSSSSLFAGKKKKSKDWIVSFTNNTSSEVDITVHRPDGSEEFDVIGSFVMQKIAFIQGEVCGITIGSVNEGLGDYITYGSQNKLTIETDSMGLHLKA